MKTPMDNQDDGQSELLSYELDGALTAQERQLLDAGVAATPRLAAERRQLRRLDQLLAGGQVAVDAGFQARLMERLPAAGWESRQPQSWRWAVAMVVLLGAGSAVLVGTGSAQALHGGASFGAMGAIFDLFASSLLAGAGLLAASWKGVGLAMAEMFARPAQLAGFGVFVLMLNLLFFSLLRGGRRLAREALARETLARELLPRESAAREPGGRFEGD
jgi:anti-sigma factor RsiW